MTSDEQTSIDNIPAPPDGYSPAVRFEYPMWSLQIAALVVLIVAGGGLLLFLAWWQGGLDWSFGLGELLVVLLTVIVVIVVHELIHGVVYRLLGYQVTFGIAWNLGAAYAAVFGQWQKRNHNLASAVAPLIVLNLLLFPLLFVPNNLLNLIGFTAILFNTSGAVGDLYLSWRLWRMPPRTLLYDVSPALMYIYEPLV